MKNNTARKISQVPHRYLIMGIDPHKKIHVAVAMTQDTTSSAPAFLQPSRNTGRYHRPGLFFRGQPYHLDYRVFNTNRRTLVYTSGLKER